MKDAVATMGAILPDDAGGRDAVHVAVISAVAGQKFEPGQAVGFVSTDGHGEHTAVIGVTPLGIVDPFIQSAVKKGQRFWLYLYPRTITGLRHQWTHPAFADDAGTLYVPPGSKLASEQWLKDYADEIDTGYNMLMDAADRWVRTGDYFYGADQGGYHGQFEGVRTHPDFWNHYERVRGVKIDDDKRESFFTCSC